ncbi:hypothetical protein X732_30515 [Mesorhizobium sp. L2C066B000]|nr:hypothetical protein X732_30515 [Mesorhizobium sp. L2C066B000]
MRSMFDLGHDLAFRRSIRPQLVGDDALRSDAFLLQKPDQQPLGGLCISASLHDFIENITIMVDGARRGNGCSIRKAHA